MRVLLSTYGGRGDVEPLVGLAVRLCELGAEVQMCVPVDRAERPTEVGVAVVLAGPPVRPLVQGVARPSPADLPRLASEVMAAQFDTLGAAAEGFDALLATGLLPAAASARSVAEKLGIRYVYAAYCPIFLSSPHHAPTPFPGRPFPPDVTDNRVLWDLQAQIANDLFGAALNTRRASTGLPVVDNVYEYGFTNHPWLAADPTLGRGRSRRISKSCKRARGSFRTSAHSRPSWRRSWTPAHHRCTWASAACAPRLTSPGWPSRRSARRAVARSFLSAGSARP